MMKRKTENKKTKQPDKLAWVRSAAKLLALRDWEDRGTPAGLDCADLMRKLKTNPPVYLMRIQGTADPGDGFLRILESYIAVTRDVDGTPIASLATDEQIEQSRSWFNDPGQMSGFIQAAKRNGLEERIYTI
jgi:hypothetical protein